MKYWRWLASAAVLSVLAYAVRQIDWGVAMHAMRGASIGLLVLAVALNGASLTLRAIRWWVFLRAAGIGSLGLAMRGVIVACGVNNLLIANGGEAARVVLVSRATRASGAAVLATVALDRLFDPLCFGVLVLVGTLTVPLPASLSSIRFVGAAALVITLAALVMLLRMKGPRLRVMPLHRWQSHLWILRAKIIRLSTPGRFGGALLLSAGVWLLQIAEYAVVALALRTALPFAASVAAMIVINAGLVLRATPGGLGYFEFAYAIAVSHFGVSTAVAVAIAILIQMVEIIPVSVAALVTTLWAAKGRAHCIDGPLLSAGVRPSTLSVDALGNDS